MFLYFLLAHDESLAGTTGQQWHLRVHANNFEDLFRVGKEAGRNENEAERNRNGPTVQLPAQVFSPLLQIRFLKITLPMSRDRKFRTHPQNLKSVAQFANPSVSRHSDFPIEQARLRL